MSNFYDGLNLDENNFASTTFDDAFRRLMNRNIVHKMTIRKFLKKHDTFSSRREVEVKQMQQKPVKALNDWNSRLMTNRSCKQSTKNSIFLEGSKSPNRAQTLPKHEPTPKNQLNENSLEIAQQKLKTIPCGIINLTIDNDRLEKASQLYIQVLKRFNRCHKGRRIPIKDYRDNRSLLCLPQKRLIEVATTDYTFWNDEKMILGSTSQHRLPRLKRVM